MRYTENQLKEMTKPASDSEEQRMENAIAMVKGALTNNTIIRDSDYEIFAQGSYANNTNVRNNSDVDINVCYTGAFYFDIPLGRSRYDYGLYDDVDYTFKQFKDSIEEILVRKFGRDKVHRKNKCIHVEENTYRTEIDVVPTWKYRHYFDFFSTKYNEGVKLLADDGTSVKNFPKQHLFNGRTRNVNTGQRYKKLVRIIKRIHLDMEKDSYYTNNRITSFLLESLVYLLPDRIFVLNDDDYKWNDILKNAVYYWYDATKENATEWQQWTEVSEKLLLMTGHKWSRFDVNEFVVKIWNYLGYAN